MGKLCPVRPLDGRHWSMTCLSSPGYKKNEGAVFESLDMRADSARQGRSADSAHPRSARWIEAQMGKLCPLRPLDGRHWSMTCLSSPGCKKNEGAVFEVPTGCSTLFV